LEVSEKIGQLLIAVLAFREGRHDAPRPPDRAPELLEAQLTPCQIGPVGALTLEAVAIPATGVRAFPEFLAGFGVALGGDAIWLKHEKQEREHDQHWAHMCASFAKNR
jgi:hypothetical protein